jgi:HAUS augmin-like complex subunit 2
MSKTMLELGEGLALKSDILLFFKKIMQEMLRPIPVALASCTRFFEAMSAMRESFATLQDLRVGHLGKDSSQRAFGDSDFATPPWRNESSFDDLAIKTARRQEIERQEADDGSSEVGDVHQVDDMSHRRLSWPPSVKHNGI